MSRCSPARASACPQPLRVLMVEDSPTDAELCTRELKKNGYDARVDVVQTREEFAARLKAGAYDIVLADYTLPTWTGLEAVKVLESSACDIPFVLVTGTLREDDAARSLEHGAVDVVRKDGLFRIGAVVRLALARKLQRDESGRVARRCQALEQEVVRLGGDPAAVAAGAGEGDAGQVTPGSLAAFVRLNPNPTMEFSADGKLTIFNEAAAELARSLGKVDPNDMVPPETRLIVQSCVASGKSRLGIETSLGGRTLSWSFHPIKQTEVVHCYVADITERHQLESQLRHSQKLESVGRLAAGIAHDFNNVLTVIQGNTGLLRSDAAITPAMSECVQQIARAAERGSKLTSQLLAFSRRNVMQLRQLDLNEVLTGLSSLLHRTLGEDITYQFSYASDLPPIFADVGLLEQVIMNLAVNARDAMPRGGQLVVSTSMATIDETYVERHPAEARPGRFVCLSIADTGSGMDNLTLSRIFEPFFTTKEFGKGTGLGLATVYGIVKQHQGWIEVQSRPSQGSTFRIYLPPDDEAAARKRAPIPESQVPHGTETILVVEDEPPVRWIVKEVLGKYGYKVLEAGNGVEALALWHQRHGEIALLLTDIVMPVGLTGQELAEKFTAQKPGLKVIYISGYSLQVAGKGFALLDGLNFLQKPFDGAKLALAVRHCLDS